jgi:hypothetical protein
VEHLDWLCGLARRFGRRPMFWGDVIEQYPDQLDRVPRDAIVLDWDYGADPDHRSIDLFRGAGLTTVVCPGTWGWNRVLNDVVTAELNIRRYAAAGLEHGAVGLLNTDWGDDGHFNLPAGAWHPIVLGAAMAWNTDGPRPEDFDRAFGQQVFADDTGELVAVLRHVVSASNMKRSWPTFYAPVGDIEVPEAWSDERLRNWRSVSLAAAKRFGRHRVKARTTAQDMRELNFACRINALVAERFLLAREWKRRGRVSTDLGRRLLAFADQCESMAHEYEDVWLARSRRSNLSDILAVFDRVGAEARAAAAP